MIRVERRDRIPPALLVAGPIAGLLGAIVLTLVVCAVVSRQFLPAVTAAAGVFGSASTFVAILARSGALMLTGLAAALAFRAGLFNFGAEGQLLAGMLTAGGIAAANLPLPPGVLALVGILAGTLAGAAAMAVPAALKLKLGADEAVVTLMLNFLALSCLALLAPHAGAHPPPLPAALSAGIALAVGAGACGICHAVLTCTVAGFELRATGGNAAAARFAGIRAGRVMMAAGLVSGALAGFAGAAMSTAGVVSTGVLSIGVLGLPGAAGGLGYAGIAVAVLAAAVPLAVVPAALAVGLLGAAIDAAGQATPASAPLFGVALGLAMVLTLAAYIFARYHVRIVRREART